MPLCSSVRIMRYSTISAAIVALAPQRTSSTWAHRSSLGVLFLLGSPARLCPMGAVLQTDSLRSRLLIGTSGLVVKQYGVSLEFRGRPDHLPDIESLRLQDKNYFV